MYIPQVILLVFFFISMLGYILFIAGRLHKEIEVAPLLTILFQILILFSAALLNLLPFAVYGLFGLGLFLFVVSLYDFLRKPGISLKCFIRPSMIFFWPFAIMFAMLIPLLVYVNWDEFSHWGLIFKLLTSTNQLPGRVSTLIFTDYPPGGALYEYYVSKIIGVSEGSSFFAMNLVTLSSLLVLLRGISWKRVFTAALAFAFGFLWLYAVGYKLNLLLVDATLGLFFAAGVIFATEGDEVSWSSAIPVMLAALVLPIIKQTGLLFGLGVAGVYVILTFLRMKNKVAGTSRTDGRKAIFKDSLHLVRKTSRKQILILLLVLASPWVLYKCWDLHLAQLHVNRVFRQNYTFHEVASQFFPNPNPRTRTTLVTFVKGVIRRPIGESHSSTLTFILLFLAIGIVAWKWIYSQDRKKREQIFGRYVLLTLWMGLYMLGLLLAYLLSFTAYEGMMIAGFERYIGSAILGWGLIVYDDVQHFPPRLQRIPAHLQFVGLNAVLLIGCLVLGYLLRHSPALKIQEMPPARVEVQRIAASFATKMSPNAKVYHIWQQISGYQHFIMRYELAPRVTEFYGWSLGAPYSNEDVWTTPATAKQWFSDLLVNKYDYVLVSKADDRFWNDYGIMFQGYDRGNIPQLFEVTTDGLKRIK